MLAAIIGSLDLVLALLRPAVFVAGALTAIAALASYGVRTRRLQPFSPVARFTRDRIDPWLIAPMERRILRHTPRRGGRWPR
jgi:YggT family protein